MSVSENYATCGSEIKHPFPLAIILPMRMIVSMLSFKSGMLET